MSTLADRDAYRPPSAAAAQFSALLGDSYRRLLGRPFAEVDLTTADGALWLYEDAPFGVLVHDVAVDPVFVYANRSAQTRFGYSWDEFVGMPSRLSAVPSDRRERGEFLDAVRGRGYVEDYRGLRTDKSGSQFWIEDTTVWNVVGMDGILRAQAALIRRSSDA